MGFKFDIGEKVYIKDFFSCYDDKIGTITMQVKDKKRKGKKVNAYTVKFENDIVWLFDERDIRRVDE